MLGLVDAAILGHLNSASYLAAVAVGSSILAFLYWGFGFLRMGTTGLTAQAVGAGDQQQSLLTIGRSMVLGLGLGVGIILLSPALLTLGLTLIAAPESTSLLAREYAQIRIFSAPAVMLNYAIIGWMIGQQNTRWPLVIALFTNGLNVILDLVLIIGLKLNSEGAALATLIAEFSGCALALWLLWRMLANSPARIERKQLFLWRDYQQLLIVNRHLFVRTLVLLTSLAFFTSQGAQQGEAVLAANTLIMNLIMLTSFGLDGFAHAAEALVGEAVGQKNHRQFKATCLHCAYWSLATAGLFTALFVLFGPLILQLLTSIKEVQREAAVYLPWLFALPLVAVWSYLLDGIFIGATRTQAMQTSMLVAAGLVYLPCWYATREWGNHGLWFAFLALNAARGIGLAAYFNYYSRNRLWW